MSINLGFVVVEVNDDGEQRGVEDYVAQTVDVLWDDLIHEPWEALNFGDMGVAYTEEEAEALLALSPGSDERQAAATSFIASHPGADQTMAKASGWGRIGQIIVYLPLLLVKLLVYVGCSLVMLVQQVVVVFFALLAPLVLLLALSETFGGFKIIRVWAQQMIESELMIVITMLLLALLMRIGAGLRDLSSTLGWLAGAMLQAGLVVILFLMRRSIFRVVGRVVGYRAIRQISNNSGNAGIMLMGTFRDLGQDREARRQRQLQAERDARQDEMIEREIYSQDLRDRGQELRNERLEYQNEWDREHPNANPHDKYYHHYYTPRPTAEEREDGQEHQEPPERPYRRPRSAEAPRQSGATEPPRPAPDQTRDTLRPRAEEVADAPRPQTEASDAARPGAATNAPRPQGEGYTPGGYAEPVPPPPPETPGQPEHPRPKAEPWEDGEDKPELWEDK